MKDYFSYTKVEVPDCSFKISPSSIGRFFSYPSVWYRDNVLGEKSFTASTSTVLGTIVHASAESYCDGTPITRELIEEYITKMVRSQPITEDPINPQIIRDAYPSMAMTLVNDYVRKNKPTETERSLYAPVFDDIFVAGTCDNHTGDTVIDYKTYNSTTPPKSISFDYKIQALAYAFMFRYNGIPINRIRLVFVNRPIDTRSISEKTGKPIGKITPPSVTVLTEVITPEDWILIQDTLMLIALSVKRAKEDPSLVPLLFKSMKLKDTL